MEKGVEISFQLNSSREDQALVEGLANLTGNYLAKEIDLRWQIFHVTLEEKKFYKILFTGKKLNKLHPKYENEIRRKFDELAHMDYSTVMDIYSKESAVNSFRKEKIREIKEEYDLWQDKLWNYI